MSMQIGRIIKELRTKKGITQDQLAAFIGMTPQAISRWESQNGYPDIEILPLIADYFSVSVDELLGRKLEEKERRRGEIYQKIKENDELGLGEEVLAEARGFAAEFPADETIQENLADTICRAYMWGEDPDLAKLAEAVRIFETLAATTHDVARRNNILESLAYLYAVAFKDKYKLEQTLAQLPQMAYSREAVGANAFWQLDRSRVRVQDYMEKLTDALGMTLKWYTVECMDNAPAQWETKIAMFDQTIGLYRFVFGEDMGFYHGRVAELYRVMATYRLAQGKHEEAIDCLEAMLEHIRKKLAAKPGDRYASPLMNELGAGAALPGLGEFHELEVHNEAWYTLHERLSGERYAPLRTMPRFARIVEALAEIAE